MRLSIIIGLFVGCNTIFAQPINDECENAIELTNLYEWCSEERAFKIYNATPSFPDDLTCDPYNFKALKDIWFSFTAEEENLKMLFNTVDLLGQDSKLRRFTMSLYTGTCDDLVLDTCEFSIADGSLGGVLLRLQYQLTPNQIYFMRIATPIDSLVLDSNLFDTIGNFTMCLDSYSLDLCAQMEIVTSPDTTINFGSAVTLVAKSYIDDGMINYQWYQSDSLLCSECPDIQVRPETNTTYTVIASNTDQCVTSQKVEVKVRIRAMDRIIFVPNAFTPNGDKVNDRMTVFGSKLLQSVLQFDVYDRWGNLAFRKLDFNPNEVDLGWDGSTDGHYYSGGTFVYLTRVQFIDGSVRQFEGSFHLIR